MYTGSMRSSIAPRYSSVPPVLGSSMSRSVRTTSMAQGYRPSYCAAPAKYFTTTPVVATSVNLTHRAPSKTPVATRYYDPTYPTRQFGSRLAKGYTGTHVRPSLHEESYSTSFLPSYGRDSWSAYKVSDSSMDLNDDIAYLSKRRDYEVLKGVEQAMANAARPTFVRASSVPPQSAYGRVPVKAKTITTKRVSNVSAKPGRRMTPAKSVDSVYYSVPAPKVNVVYESVPAGRDLLTAKEKLLSREVVDLQSPSGTMALKMRLADAHALLDRQGAMISKYNKGGTDKDMMEIESEVRRIKNSQAMRAKSVI